MKVILLTDVKKVGRKGEVVEVADGYGQNVLLKQNLALHGTSENLKRLARETDRVADKKIFNETLLGKSIQSLEKKVISISVRANNTGTLFETIHKKQVIEAIERETGILIPEKALEVEDIKQVGTHEAVVSGGGKHSRITLQIGIV